MGYSEGAMRLGPVARKLIDPCAWKDGYPGPPAYVRELDALLHFANQNGYLRRFVPNLEARDRQRDKFLNELRLAYFFRSFEITEWDPPGANGNPNALPATQLPSSWTPCTTKFSCIVRGTDPRQGIMYL